MYLEGYDLVANSRVVVSALSENAIVWRDTITLTRHGNLDATTFALPTSRVGVGQLSVLATLSETVDTVRSPLFVSFGDEWAIGSLDEMLNYLRYFATPERLKVLRDTPSDERARAWAAFWRETDPIPSTPEHEGLRDYFNRLQQANVRFRNEAASGWLTDRGKVFITLGEPDQILEQGESNQINGRGRAQVWSYYQHHLQLVFIDQTGFGHWRLTTNSEGEFERVARRERVR
jgi:GWxTD domain-containing protein